MVYQSLCGPPSKHNAQFEQKQMNLKIAINKPTKKGINQPKG